METAWERAVTHGDVEGVRELLAAGVDVNARNQHGADLNVTAKYNLTALMLAIVAGHVAVARLVTRAGADLHVKGSGAPGFSDKTAYDLAIAREMSELYAELERA